jgi:hypothetical protein
MLAFTAVLLLLFLPQMAWASTPPKQQVSS